MDYQFYFKIIAIVIFICIVIYQYPYLFYPQELTEGFLTSKKNIKEEKPYILEKSIKFSQNEKYNNDRYIYLYSKNIKSKEEAIFKNNKFENEFVTFYQDRKNNRNKKFYQLDIENPPKISGPLNVNEIIIGEDKGVNSKKIYYTADNNIYGMVKKNNKIYYRYYSLDDNYTKDKLEKLIGKERTDIFYKVFNIKKDGKYLLEDKKSMVFEIFESDSLNNKRETPIAYNFFIKPLNFKLGFQKEKLNKFLKAFNCNTDGFEEWCDMKENKSKNIYWLAITRKSVKPTITFYYRD